MDCHPLTLSSPLTHACVCCVATGIVLHDMGRGDEAMAAYRKALRVCRTDRVTHGLQRSCVCVSDWGMASDNGVEGLRCTEVHNNMAVIFKVRTQFIPSTFPFLLRAGLSIPITTTSL